jgi:hypothetical protein
MPAGAANYNLTIKNDTSVIAGPTTYTGDANVQLALGDFEDWALDLLNVELACNDTFTVDRVYLQIDFDDQLSWADDEPRMFAEVQGWQDQAACYVDGAVIAGAGTCLRNPVHVLQALLRGRNLHQLATAKVADAGEAATLRADWAFDLSLFSQVDEGLISRLAFDAGLLIWKEAGAWQIRAMDKTRAPSHFFAGGWHHAVDGQPEDPTTWQYSLELEPADASQILNEYHLRYAPHPATGTPQAAVTASAQYRLTGTCSTAAAGTLVDASATFVTDAVTPGERIFVQGDIDYVVDAVTSETELEIRAADGGSVTDNTGATYWLGPNLRGECVLSQLAYKQVNALGGRRQTSFLEDSGYVTEFIYDDDTAALLLEHLIEWNAHPRDRATFRLMHDSVKLQVGDVFLMDHPQLKGSQRAVAVLLLRTACDEDDTVLEVTLGESGKLREDDWLYVQDAVNTEPEAMLVTHVDTATDRITVARGQLNTTARAHEADLRIWRLQTKWLVTGLRPMTPEDTTIAVEVELMPNSYFPIGRVVEDGYPSWAGATAAQRLSAGWATLRNGRVEASDPNSAVSYVG